MAVYDSHFRGYRIFVGDLGRQATRYDVEREYERYGKLVDVWVARNPPGFAFIVFKNLDECERAVRKSHGRRICGRRVRVEYARPFDDRSGKQQPPVQTRMRSRSPRRRNSPLRDSSRSRSPRRRSRSPRLRGRLSIHRRGDGGNRGAGRFHSVIMELETIVQYWKSLNTEFTRYHQGNRLVDHKVHISYWKKNRWLRMLTGYQLWQQGNSFSRFSVSEGTMLSAIYCLISTVQ
ncbi:serine/arginine-rich splicing factor 3-like isoform X1 [Watersipora subatra]|uniref:serine/arginine-rich splicing factor 3-like isoform X1 n=1 Tax=Watersipora subatra TaxID=2589382 RepID=UPI00355BB77B